MASAQREKETENVGFAMKNDQLKDILVQPDSPDLDDATRERIVTSAAIRYRHATHVAEAKSPEPASGWLTWTSKPLLVAAAALALVVAILNPLLRVNTNESGMLGTDRYSAAVFSEYQALFQHELRAVVARNGDVNVILGGQASQQSNPLVFIRMESDGQPVYITAYSGQTIEAEIGGKSVTLDILTTADQGVVLAADEFMLENGVLHGPDNFVADAHVLEVNL